VYAEKNKMSRKPRYSVIVPTLNEVREIDHFIENIKEYLPGCEIIVCDGGSKDGTIDKVIKAGVILITSKPGRGNQCYEGGKIAQGEVLLFLHVDSRFVSNSKQLLDTLFWSSNKKVANFTVQFKSASRKYRILEFFTQFDTIFTRFGDQGILVKRNFYQKNPFPKVVIFEDVNYLRSVRRETKIYRIPVQLITSTRRFEHLGFYKTNLQNCWLMLLYLLGTSEEKLYKRYYRKN